MWKDTKIPMHAISIAFGIAVGGVAIADTLKSLSESESGSMDLQLEKIDKGGERNPTAGPPVAPLCEPSEDGSRVVNGIASLRFPTAGALLEGTDRQSAKVKCSGTLIGCDIFLTAAHCFVPKVSKPADWTFGKPEYYRVYFQNAGIFDVESIFWPGKEEYVHPTSANGSRSDVAVLKLKSIVEGIRPLPINGGARLPMGTCGLIVGFGRTGGSNYDYGIKRVGRVAVGQCTQTYGANLVCWDYQGIGNTPGDDANTCNADSGGGLHYGTNDQVGGITSGGLKYACSKGDKSYDTDVATYSHWIRQIAKDRLQTASCGPFVTIDPSVHVRGDEAKINAETPQIKHVITVGMDIAVLRVAMNGEDNGTGKNDFDLYLLRGESDDLDQAVCKEDGPGQFAYCEIVDPHPGPWTIVVTRKKGEGLVQLAVTRLPKR